MSSKKLMGAALLSAGLVGGGVVGALFGAPGVSVAQEGGESTTTVAEDPAAEPETPEGEGDDRAGCGLGRGLRLAALDVAAETLGVTEEELREALRGGDSIADVAAAEGVEVQTVIDALVAAATERIDQAVADGDLDAEQAAERKETLEERMTDLVERDGPPRGPGPGRGFRR